MGISRRQAIVGSAVVASASLIPDAVTKAATPGRPSNRPSWHYVPPEPIILDSRDFLGSGQPPETVRTWFLSPDLFPVGIKSLTILVTSIPTGRLSGHWRVSGTRSGLREAAGVANLQSRPISDTIFVAVNVNRWVELYYGPYFTGVPAHVKFSIVAAQGNA
jgi:hypothetical protein